LKKSFTLIEVLISIILFSILLIFLYQALEMTKKSNKFYSNKLTQIENKTKIKKLFFSDFRNKSSKIINLKDKEENSIIYFNTSNTFHNPFYTNIIYLVTKKHNLVRMECKNKFSKKKITDDYLQTCYIDNILQNIKNFNLQFTKSNNEQFVIYINNNKEYFFITE